MRSSQGFSVLRGLFLGGVLIAVSAGAQPARAVVKTWSNPAGGSWSLAASL